jgi:hypothetical protein
MQNAAADAVELAPHDRNDAHRAVVSDRVSLIGHVQTSLRLIERAIAAEISFGGQESSAGIIVLDDVSPRYMKTAAALRVCDSTPHGFPQHPRLCRKRAGAFGRRSISGSRRRPSGARCSPATIFSHGLSRAVDRPCDCGLASGIPRGRTAATLPRRRSSMPRSTDMNYGQCMFGPGNRLRLWNGRYVKNLQGRARQPARPQAILSLAFDDAPGRFLACLPRRK